ncbi:MAG: (d)CMP kinase [Nitrospira sp.]|nr:(d)CMP kinase [Nitrospira sp.]
MIIAIDGPAGVGKSTVAKLLAAKLGFLYLDTGALYRAVAWKVLKSGISPMDRERVEELLPVTSLDIRFHNGTMRVLLDGCDVTSELRTPDVSAAASLVSAIPAVREWLLPLQRRIGERGSVVVEGRDIGTRIFPSAPLKFFLDADAKVRAERRHRELVAAGHAGAMEATYQDLSGRDMQDRTRSIAPLVPAADARSIDTSDLSVEQVVERMMAAVSAAL